MSTIGKRLRAIETKVITKLSPLEARLCQDEDFVALVSGHGLNIEDLKRSGNILGALPCDLLRALVERLKVANAAG